MFDDLYSSPISFMLTAVFVLWMQHNMCYVFHSCGTSHCIVWFSFLMTPSSSFCLLPKEVLWPFRFPWYRTQVTKALEKKKRHLEVCEFYVQGAIQAKLLSLAKVKDAVNCANFLTKHPKSGTEMRAALPSPGMHEEKEEGEMLSEAQRINVKVGKVGANKWKGGATYPSETRRNQPPRWQRVSSHRKAILPALMRAKPLRCPDTRRIVSVLPYFLKAEYWALFQNVLQ